MSEQELIGFCKEHNVEITLEYMGSEVVFIRMQQDEHIVTQIITEHDIIRSADWGMELRMILNRMVSRLGDLIAEL